MFNDFVGFRRGTQFIYVGASLEDEEHGE